MSRIICTGAAGFFASHLIPRLLDAGHEVTGIDIVHPSDAWRLGDLITGPHSHPNFTYQWGSAGDWFPIRGATVIHAAAVTDIRFSRQSPRFTLQRNLLDCAALLEECARQECPHLILFSTHSVYGPGQPQPIPESAPLRPGNFYGAAKAAQELLASAYRYEWGLPITVVRPSLMYGERERQGALVTTFLRRALTGQRITLDGGGHQSRDMNHAANTADAIMLLLDPSLAHNRTLNIGGGEEITIRQLAEMACSFAGRKLSECVVEGPPRAGEEGRLVLDPHQLMELGYKPQVDFAHGFERTALWVQKQVEQEMGT